MLPLYTIYKFTYLQNRLQRNGFWQAVHLIHGYLWVDLVSSCYSFTHSRVYAIFQNRPRCTNQHHTSRKNSVLPLLFFIVHTQQRCCFPFEGQCWECFTSRCLIWDTDGLGLPRDTPLAVTFCLWDSVIKLRMRTSLNLLCDILPPHVLWSRKALRMVISVRRKNSFLVHFHVLLAIP